MNFDPLKHKIVAVVTEKGPEQGQHFHLSLPDFVREVQEITVIKEVEPAAVPSDADELEVLRAEISALRDELASREAVDDAGVSALRTELDALKAREPTREVKVVESTSVEKLPQEYVDQLTAIAKDLERFKNSQEFVLPQAFAELVERVANLEARPIDITPPSNSAPEVLDRVEALEGAIAANGDLFAQLGQVLGAIAETMGAMARIEERIERVEGRLPAEAVSELKARIENLETAMRGLRVIGEALSRGAA